MKKLLRSLNVLLLLLPTFAALFIAGEVFASAEAAYTRMRPLIFQVKTSASANLEKSSYGSGFVVDKQGLLITNYHVVADALWKPGKLKIFVVVENENKEAEIVKVDFINDLALIKIDQIFNDQIHLPNKPPAHGEDIYSIGLPQDIDWTVTAGIYNGSIKRGPFEMIHMSTSINPGMSGGPTLNRRNELVAVNASGYLMSQQISFGVPYQKVKQLLDYKFKVTKSEIGKDRYQAQLQEQLDALQKEMTEEILESFSQPKEVGGLNWPNFNKYIKCWGNSTEDEKKDKYHYDGEVCRLENSVPLANDTTTGSYSFEIKVFTNKGLNRLAWEALKSNAWDHPLRAAVPTFNSESKINFSSVKCTREVVTAKAGAMTIAVCSQKIIPLNNLADVYVMFMKPLAPDRFVRSEILLSGFSKENVKKIMRALMDQNFDGVK